MADQIFEDPRLVEIYDEFDGEREDLQHYLKIVEELNAVSILDIGCGTGCFANLLADRGFEVTGVDPASASLDIARHKPNAHKVKWIQGDAKNLPFIKVDLAVMTGNVAQVFLTDESWENTIIAIRRVLKPTGHFVFEVRDPTQKAWLDWTREKTYQRINVPKIGFVSGWCEVTEILGDLVSFRWTYTFEGDGTVLSSDSTLRFRDRESIERSLRKCEYEVIDVRGAPDRPGKEFVFIVSPSKNTVISEL